MKAIWKKTWFLILLCALSALALTGCSGNADTMNPTPTPGATENPMPGLAATDNANGMGDAAPDSSASPSVSGTQTLEDAKENAQGMEEAVEKLSEVKEAYVFPMGDTALVGLEFAKEYQGQVDDRVKKMVLARIQTVDKSVSSVAVTDNAALVTGIQALAKGLDGAGSLEDVNDKAEEILKQLTVFKQ